MSAAAVSAAALLAVLVSVAAEPAKPAITRHVVHIQGMLFRPAKLTISPGDSVEWINDDVFLHAVKSSDPNNPWQSKDLPPHASWTRPFEVNATYLCPYHPTMTGEIAVSAAVPPSASK